MSTKNGGPAFPVSEDQSRGKVSGVYGGMTLRDAFAIAELGKVNGRTILDIPSTYDRLATHCYRMADAMLAARES